MDLEPADPPNTQLAWYFACGAFLEFIAFLVTIAVVLAIRDAQAAAMDTGLLSVCLFLLVPFHICGVGLLLYPLNRWRGHQKFREMLVQTDRVEIHPGDPVLVTIHLQPNEAMSVDSLMVSLRCIETTGGGSAPRVLSNHESRLSTATVLDASRRTSFEFTTRIPAGSSPTLEQGPRRVTWTVHLQMPTALDPNQSREFHVPVSARPAA